MRKKFFLVFLSSILCTVLTVNAQSDIVMQITSNSGLIEGESTLPNYSKWIVVSAYSNGVSTTVNIGPGGAGVPNFQDLAFTLCVDKSMIPLKQVLFTGQPLTKVNVEFLKSSPNGTFAFYKIQMEGVYITSISEGGSVGNDVMMANVTFSPSRVRYIYTPTLPSGLPGTPMQYGWDRITNNQW